MLTEKDYTSTEGSIAYCKSINLKELRAELPAINRSKMIQERLWEHGIDYDISYITMCLRVGNGRYYNHYVIEIANSLRMPLNFLLNENIKPSQKVRKLIKPKIKIDHSTAIKGVKFHKK